MNYGHFGDTYDFVKHSLLQRLGSCGRWAVHPMFTDPDPTHYAAKYCRFLGVPAVTRQTHHQIGRNDWLTAGNACGSHLFFDPDTGLRFNRNPPAEPEKYLMLDELVEIVEARPDKLTLVYDHSFDQGLPVVDQIEDKLLALQLDGINGFAHRSQGLDPKLLLVSANSNTLAYARGILLDLANLPEDRLIEV